MYPNSHRISIKIEAADVDFKERLKISSMLTYMQMIADRHAEMLHCSRKQIENDGLCWVIARLRLDIYDCPRYGDTVVLETWPGKPDRLTFPRFFRFTNAAGETVLNAASKYMLINLDTREFVRPDAADFYKYMEPLREEVNPQPERIRMKNHNRERVFRTPVFSDIDMNGHMNNARYAEWVCDLFPTSAFERKTIGRMQINYVSDAKEGAVIALDVEEENGSFIVKGVTAADEKPVFECAGEWTDE